MFWQQFWSLRMCEHWNVVFSRSIFKIYILNSICIQMKKLYNQKVIFERTQIWAQGLDQWTTLSAVSQFRWTVCCSLGTNSLYNFTELCTLILDIFIQMCTFFPSRFVNLMNLKSEFRFFLFLNNFLMKTAVCFKFKKFNCEMMTPIPKI